MNENKQATETYAVKLDSEVKEELQGLIREYNDQGTQGDFIRLLVETFKTNKISNVVVDTKSDLRELNTLTTRIYNLYSNLIERNSSSIEGIKADIVEKIQDKEDVINKLKENIEELKLKNSIKSDEIKEIEEFNGKLLSELNQLRDRTDRDTMLIDKLSQEVEDIKELKIENSDMSKEIKEISETLNFMSSTNKELQNTIRLNEADIASMSQELEKVMSEYKQKLVDKDISHKEEVEKKDLEHLKEIDSLKQDLESESIKQTLILKEEHQKEIKILQDKSFEEKEKLQDKYNERMDKYEQEKAELQKQIEELKSRY